MSQYHNVSEVTVSELSQSIKRTVEHSFEYLRVRGEISGLSRPASGHVYFSLKDDRSVLASVCWRSNAMRLQQYLEDGLEVICTGKVTTYPGQSKYQLVVERIEPAGQGALMVMLEKRRAQLAKEGLFDPSRKLPLPKIPQNIGVITSPTGAVIQDILHRIRDRYELPVFLWPVQVQGELSAGQIVAAIEGFNRLDGSDIPVPDVLIIARGGGSIEDLWSFNEEDVVRAVARSKIPIISAVGHETDTTLTDYVADKRAPTPTAAAEMAVPVKDELHQASELYMQRIKQALRRVYDVSNQALKLSASKLDRSDDFMARRQQDLDVLGMKIEQFFPKLFSIKQERLLRQSAQLISPEHLVARREVQLNALAVRLDQSAQLMVSLLNQKLQTTAKLMDSYHYNKVLQRGFSLVMKDDKIVSSASQVTSGDKLDIELADGKIMTVVE